MNLGWWLQVIGGFLAVVSACFLFAGFLLSPVDNILKSLRTIFFQIHFGNGDNVAGNKIVEEKKLFSSTQSIRMLPPSLGGNNVLSLDNAGVLRSHVPYSENSIALLLDVVTIAMPSRTEQESVSEGIEYYNQNTGEVYVFDTDKNKRHRIVLGTRIFTVTLLKINLLKASNVPNAIEYQFGISEE
jgi:hypothetical protein